MTKEQVILAYHKKYGHIADLFARIVTQLDLLSARTSYKDIALDVVCKWDQTVEGAKFWSDLCTLEDAGTLYETTFNEVSRQYRMPVPPREQANEILNRAKEIHDRKQMFEALKTLVELDFTDGGSRVIGSNEIREMKVVHDYTRIVMEVPGELVNSVGLGRKRALLLIVDAAEYDKVDNDEL